MPSTEQPVRPLYGWPTIRSEHEAYDRRWEPIFMERRLPGSSDRNFPEEDFLAPNGQRVCGACVDGQQSSKETRIRTNAEKK